MFKKEITVNPIEKESRYNTKKNAYKNLFILSITILVTLSFLISNSYVYENDKDFMQLELKK